MMREHGSFWSSGDTSDVDPDVFRGQEGGPASDKDEVCRGQDEVSEASDLDVIRGLDQIDIDVDFPDFGEQR